MATSESSYHIVGEKTIAAAGTAERLHPTSKVVKSLAIIAKGGNTNQAYHGGVDVDSSTNDGMDALEFIVLPGPLDLTEIYIDVDTNGEGVDFVGVK